MNFSSVWVQLRPQVGLSLYFMLITSAIVGGRREEEAEGVMCCEWGPEEARRQQATPAVQDSRLELRALSGEQR